MPRAGPLKQMLRALNVAELRAIRREYCPRVRPYPEQDGKTAFVDSLRNSLKRSMDDGDLSYEELMDFVQKELTDDTPQRITTKVRNVLDEIEFSPNSQEAGSKSMREKWYSSEIYQALQYELADTPYEVRQEESFGRNRVDLFIDHRNKDRCYAIEIKLANNTNGRERLPTQVSKYRHKIPHLRRIFACLIINRARNMPENKDAVQHVVNEVNDKDRAEIIVKPIF